MQTTRLPALFAVFPVVLACCGCSAESRLWRLSPFSGTTEKSSDRMNLWPLAYSAGSGASILWPLMDFDQKGFAVRPLVSRNDSDLDILFPLSHFNTDSGDGWALTAYKYHDDFGLFPLCNFGPSFNYFIPAFWKREGGKVTSCGVFPVAGVAHDFGYVGPAWWTGGNTGSAFGLFPLFTWGDLKWIGPAWWNDSGLGDKNGKVAAGVFPLVWKWDDPTRLLVLPLYYGDPDRRFFFPLYYGDAQRDVVFPFYYGKHDADDDLNVLLMPPTWWENRGNGKTHVVFPFYAHLADAHEELTAFLPFYGSKTTNGQSHWFSPIGDGWNDSNSSGLNLYPLWYSAQGKSEYHPTARQMLLPFYMVRENGDDRLLLTPLGGRGWDASGALHFLNVLGPVYHHSESGDSATTAIAWPLFERDRTGDTTKTTSIPFFGSTATPAGSDTWLLAGLGRCVSMGEESSFRLIPLYSRSNAKKTPDMLWDLSLVGTTSHEGSWSAHVFPLYWGSGDTVKEQHDSWMLAGLSRYVADGKESSFRIFPLYSQSNAEKTPDPLFDFTIIGSSSHGDGTPEGGSWSRHFLPLYWGSGDTARSHTDSWLLAGLSRCVSDADSSSFRLFPLYSQSNAAETPDPLFDFTLVGAASHGDRWSGHVFPLYWGDSDGRSSSHTALLGLARVGTTESGSAWRLWPLASGSNDPAADGWFDPVSLFRHERTDSGSRDWLMPLYYKSQHGENSDVEVLPPLFHHETTAKGSAWRLWPLFTDTDADGLDGWLDSITLFASHEREEKTHLHIGTDAIFGFDRTGEGKRSWNARLFTLCEFGHDERSPEAAEPGLKERTTVARNHAGFLFDWFLVDQRVTLDHDGGRRDESHYRLPLLQEYKGTPEKKEWDLLCYAVHSTETKDEGSFSVLGYGYRRERKGDAVKRDIFPFVTWDDAPDSEHVSFMWHLFHYERQGDRTGGHVLFIPWGNTD